MILLKYYNIIHYSIVKIIKYYLLVTIPKFNDNFINGIALLKRVFIVESYIIKIIQVLLLRSYLL